MKQNNKKFNNAMHKFVGVLDKYAERSIQKTKLQVTHFLLILNSLYSLLYLAISILVLIPHASKWEVDKMNYIYACILKV